MSTTLFIIDGRFPGNTMRDPDETSHDEQLIHREFSAQPTIIEDYNVVVYMLSYDGPLSHLNEITTDIVNRLGITSGKVLFDALTSKGNVKNRFYSAEFDNGQFVKDSFEIVHYGKNSDVRKASSQFYKDQDLKHSLVTNVQKRILKNGYVL